MAQVYFDTLRFVETLEASGVPANQARAISEAVYESRKELDLATKGDISELKATVKREVDDLRVATKHDISELQATVKREVDDLRVATKHDISELQATVKREVDDLRVATKHDIEDVRKDMEIIRKDIIIKIGSMFVVAVGVLAAIIKFPV